jgi:GT2 family glycosyltransferase
MSSSDGHRINYPQRTEAKADNGQVVGIDLSIIVVSFNTRDMTLDCLRSIVSQTRDISYEIIVVDNSSVDDSVEAIRKEFPRINLMASDTNLGFAKANNVACEHARGQRILLLNPDTVVIDNAIDRLFAFANANPACQVWGGRTLFGDGSLNPTSCWGRISLWSLLCFALGLTYFAPGSSICSPEAYGGWKRDTVRHVDIVTGCFLMIDRALWNKLGGFNPLFFMYGEEADLCHRASRAGARPIVTPTATIIHYGSASDVVPVEKRIKVFKARLTLIDTHFPPLSRGLARQLHLLWPVVRCGAYQIANWAHPGSNLANKAAYWREICRRRSEWLGGYRVGNANVLGGRTA